MNVFMRSIMNNNIQRQTNRTSSNQSSVRRPAQRRQFEFRRVYSRPPQRHPSSLNTSRVNSLVGDNNNLNSTADAAREAETGERVSVIQYNLFNVMIDVNVNNLTSELINTYNANRYYSTFEYESLNIRFFHNEMLNLENVEGEIETVLNSINEREFQNILNEFQNNEMADDTLQNDDSRSNNSQEVIQKIYQNITQGEYVHHSSSLKNHTCPILLTDFEDDDIVSIFNKCSHAIHESMGEKYFKTFTKCPLCNHKLFEL